MSFCPYYFLLFFILIIIYLFFLAQYSLYDTKKILEEFAVFELFKTFWTTPKLRPVSTPHVDIQSICARTHAHALARRRTHARARAHTHTHTPPLLNHNQHKFAYQGKRCQVIPKGLCDGVWAGGCDETSFYAVSDGCQQLRSEWVGPHPNESSNLYFVVDAVYNIDHNLGLGDDEHNDPCWRLIFLCLDQTIDDFLYL